MKRLNYILLSALIGLCMGFSTKESSSPLTVYTIGDSTMANKPLDKNNLERGWGQALGAYFDSRYVIVDNHAMNGRSSKSFFNEGRWQPIYDNLKKGDYVFIQFGHNDEKPKEDRHTDPGSTFNEQLKFYVRQTREKGAIPVLFTPMVRRKFGEDGHLVPTHGDYPQAVRDVAAEMGVVLIDHNLSSKALVDKMGPEDSKKLFMWVEKGTNLAAPDGRQDDTHMNGLGAKTMANIILDEVSEKIPQLAPYIRRYDFVVAKDGSGDFFTVQEAINAVPDFRKGARTRIYIRSGVYKEKLILPESKINVDFIGEDAETTVLTYDDCAWTKNVFGEGKGTSGSSSFYVYGHDFHAVNLTFEASAGPVGQAVAIFVSGDRCVFDNCRFLGFQDTLYTYGKQSKQYYRNCYIEGTVDFIFGSSTAYFEGCEIHSKHPGPWRKEHGMEDDGKTFSGHLTAASTPQGRAFGYVFKDCRLTADERVAGVSLGRPWRPYAQTVFIDCEMGGHISPAGWNNWGKADNEKTAFYGETGSRGEGAKLSKRAAWAHKVKASDYTIDKVLADPEKPEWYSVSQL